MANIKLDFEKALAALREGKSARAAAREQNCSDAAVRLHAGLKPERRRRFEEAEREGLDVMADGLVDVADVWDKRFQDAMDSGVPGAASAVVQMAKLEVDARKWALAKRHPGRYGDKLAIEHGGGVAVGVGLLAGDGEVREKLRQVFELGGAGRAIEGGAVAVGKTGEAEAESGKVGRADGVDSGGVG